MRSNDFIWEKDCLQPLLGMMGRTKMSFRSINSVEETHKMSKSQCENLQFFLRDKKVSPPAQLLRCAYSSLWMVPSFSLAYVDATTTHSDLIFAFGHHSTVLKMYSCSQFVERQCSLLKVLGSNPCWRKMLICLTTFFSCRDSDSKTEALQKLKIPQTFAIRNMLREGCGLGVSPTYSHTSYLLSSTV